MPKYRVYHEVKATYAIDIEADTMEDAEDKINDYDLSEWEELAFETVWTDMEELND